MGKKDTGISIHVLEKEDYFHWKVKMHLHLLSLDTSYVQCIEKGPHVPMKIVTSVNADGTMAPDKFVPKTSSEFTEEDEKEVHKDKKAMNILFNGLDKDMFDNVINCTTSKEVWDTIQTLCEGTEQVRHNKLQLLIQKYEAFHFKHGESVNDTYNRFQKLLNGLKLYGRIYSTEDTNMKFLRSLPKEWKPMTVSLRHSHEFKEYTLEKLYGVLRTYELEIQQDEEIEKSQKKKKSVALVVQDKDENKVQVENKSGTTNTYKSICEEEGEVSKGKLKMEGTEDLTKEELEEIDEHLAFLSKRFSKLKFKRNPSMSRPPTSFRKDNQPGKSFVDRSKFKCFNCGIAGHFSNECKKPKSEKKGRATDGIDYKKKYYDLLRQKEKAFVSEERDWAAEDDDSDEEEFINLAFMAESDDQEASSSTSQVLTTNLSDLTRDECKITIDEMSNELYNLHVSLKSLTKENSRLKISIDTLSERNSWLEGELVSMERLRIECQDSKNELVNSLKREESLREELTKEQDVIKSWNNSTRVTRSIIENRIKETFLDPSSSQEKKPVKGNQSTDNCLSTDNSETDYPSIKKSSTDNNYLLNKAKPTDKMIKNMKEKYGGTENFVKEGTPPKDKIKKVVSDSAKDLSSKHLGVTDTEPKTKVKKKKKNRNGKVGINKHNNYAPDMYAPRKVCAKCGSVNHLSIDCKTVVSSTPSQSLMPNLATPTLPAQFAQMPFMNPFLTYNMNFATMPWNMNPDYSLYASQFQNAINSDFSKIEQVNVPLTQSQTPKVKVELNSTKPMVEKTCKKSRGVTNKDGPKTAWVPKST